jgi:hypothetical protein
MPYAMRKLPKQDAYKVFNKDTGVIHSKHTSLENAEKQIRLLEQIASKEGGSIILDQKLYDEVKADADKKYKKNSAYKSGWIVKTYKERGGEYKDDKEPKDLKRWFKEDWKDIGGQDYPVYRPTKRISKDTPLTADEIDPVQLKEQIELKQQIKGNKNLPKFMKGSGLIVDDYTKQVNLPYTQDVEAQLPPFMIRKNNKKVGYNYKLVNPLTKERHLSQRGKALNVGVARRIIPKPRMAVYEADFPQPNLRDFSPADRALLEKYDGLMDNYIDEFKNKDYQSIPEVDFKNETRGLPCKLPANCAKRGHKKGEKQHRGFDNIDGTDTKRIPIDEWNARKGKRGRPKKARNAPSAPPEEEQEQQAEDGPDIEFDIQEEEEPKTRGRKKKYATAEEAKAAKKAQTLISNKRQKDKQKAERQQMGMEDRDVGLGLAEKNKISSNNKMPNKWVEHTKKFAVGNGLSYSDALKHPKNKASYLSGKGMKSDSDSDGDVNIDIDVGENHTNRKGKYKMGGASPYTTQPGKITTQNRHKVVPYPKMGFGLDGGRQNDKVEAAIYNESQLGANAGKKFISL